MIFGLEANTGAEKNSEAEYADAGCRAAADWKEPAAQENGTPQKKPPKVHGLGPTISRRSQRE